jgi:cation diffusion facilitator CzcD-associated flavoprotein CzcO
MDDRNAIIIGAGPSDIAMAPTLKQKLGYNNFEACLAISYRRPDCLVCS